MDEVLVEQLEAIRPGALVLNVTGPAGDKLPPEGGIVTLSVKATLGDGGAAAVPVTFRSVPEAKFLPTTVTTDVEGNATTTFVAGEAPAIFVEGSAGGTRDGLKLER
jgi:hypothetical protein